MPTMEDTVPMDTDLQELAITPVSKPKTRAKTKKCAIKASKPAAAGAAESDKAVVVENCGKAVVVQACASKFEVSTNLI